MEGEHHEVACYFPARFHDGKRSVSEKPFLDAAPDDATGARAFQREKDAGESP